MAAINPIQRPESPLGRLKELVDLGTGIKTFMGDDSASQKLDNSVAKQGMSAEDYMSNLSKGLFKEVPAGTAGSLPVTIRDTGETRNIAKGSYQDESQALRQTLLGLQVGEAKAKKEREAQGGQLKKEQYDAAGFARRIEQSENVLSDLEQKGFDPTRIGVQIQGALAPSLEILKSEPVKAYQTAKKNFITATLRRESGAAISPSEFKEQESIYFPLPGDSREILAQKAALRAEKLAEFQTAAGGAYGEVTKNIQNKGERQKQPAQSNSLIKQVMEQNGVSEAIARQFLKTKGLL